jgi:hypothetical protein
VARHVPDRDGRHSAGRSEADKDGPDVAKP